MPPSMEPTVSLMSRQQRSPGAPSARIAVSMPSHTSFPSAPVTRDSLPMLMIRPSPFGRHSHGNENAMHARSVSPATVSASSAMARNISSASVSSPSVPGMRRFCSASVTGFPVSSKRMRPARRFVPPASSTRTLSPVRGAPAAGRNDGSIISVEASPRSPARMSEM